MLSKIIILLACTLLLTTLFNIANAEEGVCRKFIGGTMTNSTPVAVSSDFCGADIKASSCCTNTEIEEFGFIYEPLKTNSSCASIFKVESCGKCSVKNQKYVVGNRLDICKSFCEKIKSACSTLLPWPPCDSFPETDCFSPPYVAQSSSDFAINKVSAFVMTLVVMMLGIFAL